MTKPKKSKKGSMALKGVGNTKSTPKRMNGWLHCCFTWNNYPDNWEDMLCGSMAPIIKRAVMQEEIGENGTPHIQGYCEFLKKERPIEKIGIKDIHWEKTKNVDASIAYCQKEDTRKPGGKVIIVGFARKINVYKISDKMRSYIAKSRFIDYYSQYWANIHTEYCRYHNSDKCWYCQLTVSSVLTQMYSDIKKINKFSF